MACTRIHKTPNYATGGTEMTVGYLEEIIQLGNNADAYTSPINTPIKGDITVLMDFSQDLSADTDIKVEHSYDGTTWYPHSTQSTVAVTQAGAGVELGKLGTIDDSAQTETEGWFTMFDIDTHGWAKHTRLVVAANGQNESLKSAKFTLFFHF